jgi:hypothetical protein
MADSICTADFQLKSEIWSISNSQVAAVTMQIVYKYFTDFFGNDRPKSNLISANNRRFESLTNWTILTSVWSFFFVGMPLETKETPGDEE